MIVRRGLALYIIGVLTLLILISSILFYYFEQKDQDDILNIHITNKAEDIGFVIQSLINNEVEKLYALSKSLQSHEDLIINIAVATVHEENAPAFESLIERLVSELNLDFMLTTDENGNVLYNSNEPNKRGYVANTRWMAQALKGEDMLVALQFDGVWHIGSIVPMVLGDLPVGTVIIGTRIDDEFASIFAKATGTQMSFGDTSGVLASSLPPDKRAHLSMSAITDSLALGQLVHHHFVNDMRVVSYTPVHVLDKDFSLALDFDTSDLIHLYEIKKINHLKIFGLTIAASLILGTALTLRIVSPLKQLRVRAEQTISEITGREPQQTQGDEVTSLVGSFKIMLSTVQDHLAERLRLEDELKQQAMYDSLTGLPNRMLFFDRLKNLFEHKQRQPDLLFALLFIDLDHFKKVNDSLGHMVGDQLLLSVAKRLRACTRPGDTVARFGGDEFVIILDGILTDQDAIQGAERIHSQLERPFDLGGSEAYTTASIGIAVSHRMYETPEDFLRDADTAMYHAKAKGRACHVFFDLSMHHDAVENMQLGNDLRRALERHELVLHYQPVVDIESGNVSGFEALIRWDHPLRGLLPPSEFIHLAEETGLIIPIGEWVIREACSQIRTWQEEFQHQPPLTVSVNLSTKEFNRNTVHIVERALEESGIEPDCLSLEVTESLIMADSRLSADVLFSLRNLGVQIYLDDFGTGYSSLNYIHKLPLNVLKIDRTFVKNILNDTQAQEIVKAIIALAQRLELKIIIEGIEDVRQLELFRGFQCDLVQGYLFSEPLPTGQVPAYLSGQDLKAQRPSVS